MFTSKPRNKGRRELYSYLKVATFVLRPEVVLNFSLL
jgi:hypothetical protein